MFYRRGNVPGTAEPTLVGPFGSAALRESVFQSSRVGQLPTTADSLNECGDLLFFLIAFEIFNDILTGF